LNLLYMGTTFTKLSDLKLQSIIITSSSHPRRPRISAACA